MRGIVFIAFFYVIGVLSLAVGTTDLFLDTRFALFSEQGTMTSTDPTVASVAKLAPADLAYGTSATVVYTTPQGGRIEVPRHRISGEMARRLAKGEAVPVRFLRSDPDDAIYDGQGRSTDWTPLFAGAIALAVAVFAHRLARKEAGV